MSLKTYPFDSSLYLETADDVVEYLDEVFKTGDAAFVAHAFGVVARARGMTAVARQAGLSRESLYKALSDDGNPELGTLLKVAKALGLRVTVAAE
ncbi:MAG: addiction module antidote protein [Caulobacteraceae bacterium]